MKRRKHVLAALVAVGALVAITLAHLFSSSVHLVPSINESLRLTDELPENMWFSPSGDLLGVFSDLSNLRLDKWSKKDMAARISCVFPNEFRLAVSPGDTLVYAISDDGNLLAWVQRDVVRIWEIGRCSTAREVRVLPVPGATRIANLLFIGPNLIAIVYDSGKLEAWDFSRGYRGLAGTYLGENWKIWSRGLPIVMSSPTMEDIASITFEGPDRIKVKTEFLPARVSSIATSGDRLAIVSEEGGIMEKSKGEEFYPTYMPQVLSAPVRAVAFYGEEYLLAGGDFEGIYIVNHGDSLLLSGQAGGIRHIVTHGTRVAYDSFFRSRGTFVADVQRIWRIDEQGRLILTLLALFLSIIAIVWTACVSLYRKG